MTNYLTNKTVLIKAEGSRQRHVNPMFTLNGLCICDDVKLIAFNISNNTECGDLDREMLYFFFIFLLISITYRHF